MSFVPEDRLGMGLVGSMGMTGNMMLRSWRKGHGVFLNRKDPEDLAQRIWQELEVVTPSTSFPVRRMSGGNVQKVLVGREIAQAPAVLWVRIWTCCWSCATGSWSSAAVRCPAWWTPALPTSGRSVR